MTNDHTITAPGGIPPKAEAAQPQPKTELEKAKQN